MGKDVVRRKEHSGIKQEIQEAKKGSALMSIHQCSEFGNNEGRYNIVAISEIWWN